MSEADVSVPPVPPAAGAVAATDRAAQRPGLIVMIVHGTFPRGGWQQLRRNGRAVMARLRRQPKPEAGLWLAPAIEPKQRWWFEAGSDFEGKLLEAAALPTGRVAFDRVLWSGRNRFSDRSDAAEAVRLALDASLARHPGVRHAVIAHSHGGTVAVKSLDQHRPGGAPAVAALLTLASPFVRLAAAARPSSTAPAAAAPTQLGLPRTLPEPTGFEWIGILLPALLLVLAPLAAVAYGLLGQGGLHLGLTVALAVLAVWAGLSFSMITATCVVLIAWLGEPKLGGYLPAIAFVAVLAGLFFFKDRIMSAGGRYVENDPLRIDCPVLALRAPRDEASLVIGLGQVAQGVVHGASSLLGAVWAPFGRGLDRIGERGGAGTSRFRRGLQTALLVAIGWLAAGVVGALGAWLGVWSPHAFHGWGSPAEGWLTLVVGSLWYGALSLGVMLPLLLLLAWTLPMAAMSLAAGREAFMLPAMTQVEAEPLPWAVGPDGQAAAAMTLEIMYGARLDGLNHSLYEAPEALQRMAVWLRQVDAASVPA